jgi:hypothetical protein
MEKYHMTRVLFVGQRPDTVDYSDPAIPPGIQCREDPSRNSNCHVQNGRAGMAGGCLHDPAR